MKYLLILFVSAALSACSFVADVGSYANDNPLVVNATVRQAVARFILVGETETAKAKRAKSVGEVVESIDAFIEGNPASTVQMLIDVTEQEMPWDKLSLADQLLVRDIISMVSVSLEDKQDAGMLDENAIIGLRAILHTAADTAALL